MTQMKGLFLLALTVALMLAAAPAVRAQADSTPITDSILQSQGVPQELWSQMKASAGGDPYRLRQIAVNCMSYLPESASAEQKQTALTMAIKTVDMQSKTEDNVQTNATDKAGTKKFLGFNWGLGVAATSDFGGRQRVASATAVAPNYIVRVTQSNSQQPRVVLEMHHFFCAGLPFCPEAKEQQKCDSKGAPAASNDKNASQKNCSAAVALKNNQGLKPLSSNPNVPDQSPNWGYGPWVGIQSSSTSTQAIDSIALGFMFGFRTSAHSSSSFNLGVGAILDAKAQVLGDGITANQPLPSYMTTNNANPTVPLKNVSRTGGILAVSFSF